MKKVIYRNIAIVTAIFIVTFSIMMITNYFQVQGGSPLETEIMETLKQLHGANANNHALQEQIRQLDLLSRKAYFIRYDRLMTGVHILLGTLAVFFICARGYFAGYKNIPDKDIDPVDEWVIKTKARKYMVWGVSGIAATALIFVFLTSPYLKTTRPKPVEQEIAVYDAGFTGYEEVAATDTASESPQQETTTTETTTEDAETPAAEAPPQPAAQRVNHNAFRGNNSNGVSSARNIPTRWDLAAGTNIAWKKVVPRVGMSSPVINGNKVFITGADEQARELYCFDLYTGELLWTLAAANIPGSPAAMPVDLYYPSILAASTVATNGTHVAAIFATGDIICADMDGNRVWARNFGLPDNQHGYASSLLTFGNLLIVQYDNRPNPRVMALDIATGAERWSRPRVERCGLSWASPIIAFVNNTPILVLIGCPGITAYNPNTGEQLWRVEALSGEPGASAASANGIVFAATEYAKLVAINGADGTVLWDDNFFLPDTSSPVATRDFVIIAPPYGVVVAYDAQTGEILKEHELVGGFYSSPMVVDGKIYIINQNGRVYIFTADTEFRLIESFDTGEKTEATPAFTDGKIIVRTDKYLYCVTAN